MALRFTDTNKWEDDWFLDLSPIHKLIHLYLVDRCDCAGLWKVCHRDLEFKTGATKDDWESFCRLAGKERVCKIEDDLIWIVKFIPFQNPKIFNRNNPAVKGIASRLEKVKAPIELLPSPYQAPLKSLWRNDVEAPTKPLPSPIGEGDGERDGEGDVPEGDARWRIPKSEKPLNANLMAMMFHEVYDNPPSLPSAKVVAQVAELIDSGYTREQLKAVAIWAHDNRKTDKFIPKSPLGLTDVSKFQGWLAQATQPQPIESNI